MGKRRAFYLGAFNMIQWWQQILPIWNAKHQQNPLLERGTSEQ